MLAAEERVELLLRTYEEARVSYGHSSTGAGPIRMPSMWHEGSYQELEHVLVELRESPRRQLWWHACQRYRWGVERVLILAKRRPVPPAYVPFYLPPFHELIAGGPAIGSKHALCRVYRWRDDVDATKAADGVAALTRLMFKGRTDRIMLPQLILRRRLGLPVEGERELVA